MSAAIFPGHLARFDDLISPASFSTVLEVERRRVRWHADAVIPTRQMSVRAKGSWQTVVLLKPCGSFWSEDIYGTCDRGSSEGRIYAIFRSTFVVSFLGNGVGRARAVRWPRVSIKGNKEELLKQIMSESSQRNAGRHQNALVLSPRSTSIISARGPRLRCMCVTL